MLESLFNKVEGFRSATLFKRTPTQMFSREICESFKNVFFLRTPPVAASDEDPPVEISIEILLKKIISIC